MAAVVWILFIIGWAMVNGDSPIHYPEEIHLANVTQLTFGGQNAEAYFSFDDQRIVFQATNWGYNCDQIFRFDLKDGVMSQNSPPHLVSTGKGATTCSYYQPNGVEITYASTHLGGAECPAKPCINGTNSDPFVAELCANHTYLWTVYKTFDIFKTNLSGSSVKLEQMTFTPGYDAEATVSFQGDKMVFTSDRSGDLELWVMNLDGSNQTQVTDVLGYDGGAFFSPDGKSLVFRASRFKENSTEAETYKKMLNEGLVSPTLMELFTVNVDGTNLTQITHLGAANWAPYYHPSGRQIIFSSNHKQDGFNFNLFTVTPEGEDVTQITFDPTFDAFPMFSYSGKQLIFASMRNSTNDTINLFIADYIEHPDMPTTVQTTPVLSSLPTTSAVSHSSTTSLPTTTSSSSRFSSGMLGYVAVLIMAFSFTVMITV